MNVLKKAVYDSTDPKLTPVFENFSVPEGTGRLVLMHVYPGMPPYTDTSGAGKVRVGKDCQPLTGTLRRRLAVETGESDFTAVEVPGNPTAHISAAAIDRLRTVARAERVPADLVERSDLDLLAALGVIRNARLTRAGVLPAGSEAAISAHVPNYVWTHLRMRSDTDYTDRADGREAFPVALGRVTDRIMADNPIETVRQGLFHYEYRTYPEIALREALLNAFSHADFRVAGPILVKQYSGKLEISNPGAFIGGISSKNILHHQPAARNPHLVEALTRLRLVNRSNLGISRMFRAVLVEGKEPPLIEESGDAVRVVFLASPISTPFRIFVAEEEERGRQLSVDHLLILRHVLWHPEVDTPTAGRICQRSETEMRAILSEMERDMAYLERGGTGRGTYWTLRPEVHRRLSAPGHPERDRRIDWEAAKTRVLSVLRQRAQRGEGGITNMEVRGITRLDRRQVKRLMDELRAEGQVETRGQRRGAIWVLAGDKAGPK